MEEKLEVSIAQCPSAKKDVHSYPTFEHETVA
jgi:hypothetical protein